MAQSTIPGSGVQAGAGLCVEDIRLVLIGKTGSGKSKSGNTILGVQKFKSNTFSQSVTQHCEYDTAERFGSKVMVIDTPGFFDTNRKENELLEEVVQCITLSSPGPHVFLYVLAIDKITDEVRNSMDLLQKLFGKSVLNYTIVLFTKLDELMADEGNATAEEMLSKYINGSCDLLQTFIKQCNNRYIAFNNRADEQTKDKYAECLLKMTKKLIGENSVDYYTNPMYDETEKALQCDIVRRQKLYEAEQSQKIMELENKLKKETEERRILEIKNELLEERNRYQASIANLREEIRKETSGSDKFFKTVSAAQLFVTVVKFVKKMI